MSISIPDKTLINLFIPSLCNNFPSTFSNRNIIEIKTVQLGKKTSTKLVTDKKWSCRVQSCKTMNI